MPPPMGSNARPKNGFTSRFQFDNAKIWVAFRANPVNVNSLLGAELRYFMSRMARAL